MSLISQLIVNWVCVFARLLLFGSKSYSLLNNAHDTIIAHLVMLSIEKLTVAGKTKQIKPQIFTFSIKFI